MQSALPKTKAEETLAAQFKREAALLPGNEHALAARKRAMTAFEHMGLPHRRVEAWKYTDLRTGLAALSSFATADETPVSLTALNAALGALADLDADRVVFVNGRHRPELSAAMPAPNSGMTIGRTVDAMDAEHAVAVPEALVSEAVAVLNAALVTDGSVVVVSTSQPRPLLLISVAAGTTGKLASLSHKITLRPDVTATVIEAHVALEGAAPAQSNTVVQIDVGDRASLMHVILGAEGPKAVRLETVSATLGAGSNYRSFQLTTDAALTRNQSFVRFTGEAAKLDISGLMLGRGRSHIDTTLVIDHAVPHCESRELFKAVLDDTARAVFQGKVIVQPGAQKTDGKQMSKALMLSEACEFDSKPELEIYADDVVCGHGATVAELDADLMFYLRSRGIPKAEARAMLIESFIGEVLDKVEDEALRDVLTGVARGWLAAKGEAV